MRVVTYARVSTTAQGATGDSLPNQDRKFKRWCEHGGHVIVRSYEEVGSGGSTRNRRLFTAMLEHLDQTKPDCIVIDSADRFSRNLEDVFATLGRLRERGINIWPLEWERDLPPDILTYDSEDYLRFRGEIIVGQAERKRIATRLRKSYASRRDRGLPTTNRAPYGLRRLPSGVLVRDAATAWVIEDIDRRYLAGQSVDTIADYVRSIAKTVKVPSAVRYILSNPQYVTTEVRTPETHAAIAQRLTISAKRFGQNRRHDHDLSGVFACGLCVALGVAPERALMHEFGYVAKGRYISKFLCERTQGGELRHARFSVIHHKVEPLWRAYLPILASPEIADAWADAGEAEDGERERALHRRLAEIDEAAASLKGRRDAALDLYCTVGKAALKQVERALRESEGDETALAVQRQTVLGELARPTAPKRDRARLVRIIGELVERYDSIPLRKRQLLNQALVAAVGSYPVLTREGSSRTAVAVVTWPEVDAARFGAKANAAR